MIIVRAIRQAVVSLFAAAVKLLIEIMNDIEKEVKQGKINQ